MLTICRKHKLLHNNESKQRKTPMSTFADSQKRTSELQTESSDTGPNKPSIPAMNRLIDSVKSVMVYGYAGDGKTYWGFDYEKIDRLMRK